MACPDAARACCRSVAQTNCRARPVPTARRWSRRGWDSPAPARQPATPRTRTAPATQIALGRSRRLLDAGGARGAHHLAPALDLALHEQRKLVRWPAGERLEA